MNSTYINIKSEWLTEWRLTPAEAVVYGYLHGWIVDGKKDLKQTQASMAKAVGMDERRFKRHLARLMSYGCVTTERSGLDITYHLHARMLYNEGVSKMTLSDKNNTECQKCHRESDKNDTEGVSKMSPDTLYNINNNISHNITDDDARVRMREGDGGSLVGVGSKDDRTEQQRLLGETLGVDALAEELRREVADGSAFADSAQRLYGIGRDDLAEYAGWFADKLRMDGVAYKTRSDFRRHFNNWLRIQMQRKIHEKTQRNGNNSTNRHQPQYSAEFMERLAADLTSGR